MVLPCPLRLRPQPRVCAHRGAHQTLARSPQVHVAHATTPSTHICHRGIARPASSILCHRPRGQEQTQHQDPAETPHPCLAGATLTPCIPRRSPRPQALVLDNGCCSPVLSPTTPHLPLGPCLDPPLTQPDSLPASCSPPPTSSPPRLCLELIPGVINYQFMSNLKFIIHFSHKLPKVLLQGQDEGKRQA